MVNNINTIYNYIAENIDTKINKYYIVVTVRQRRKDKGNEDMKRGEHTIKTYYISSANQLMEFYPEMMKLADMFNARI